ncbi:hypothetical protein ACEN9D_01910 [Pseudomonas sp. CT11-2]|uniref:hypothetical protein n=1 Tax=Pseudomonas sp. CT11-2 TaxID=3243023 RepID=UPI0039AF2A5E
MKNTLVDMTVLVLTISTGAHADDARVNTPYTQPRVQDEYDIQIKQIDEYSKLLKGKTLEELVNQKPIINDAGLQESKEQALTTWKNSLNTPYDPGPQVIREHLTRKNFGLPDSPDIATISATKKIPMNIDPHITNNGINQIPKQAFILPNSKIPGANQQTMAGNNTGNKYGKTKPFKNELSGYQHGATLEDLEKFRADSKNCIGTLTNSEGNPGLFRKDVYKCFKTLNSPSTFASSGYLQALNLITSITKNDGLHSCIASYYKEGEWITAGHCVTKNNLADGRNLIIGEKTLPLNEYNVRRCYLPGCDAAIILAKTPEIDYSKYELTNPKLQLITENSEVFIPGMEVGMPIIITPEAPYKYNLMWSDVGHGYCKIYRVENGCFSHTCSTLTGFSGAPVYWINAPSGKIELLGIHTGESTEGTTCAETNTNYAVTANLYKGIIQ